MRIATAPGKAGVRPTVTITKDMKLWIGNERPERLEIKEPMPLFGFGLGEFEDKVIAGGRASNKRYHAFILHSLRATLRDSHGQAATPPACCNASYLGV